MVAHHVARMAAIARLSQPSLTAGLVELNTPLGNYLNC